MRNAIVAALSLWLLLPSALSPAERKTPGEGGGSPYVGGYQFLIGLSTPDTVVMSADNGDRLEIGGNGGFSLPERSIYGGGSFVHTDSAGNQISQGAWKAVEFVSFSSVEPGGGFGGRLDLHIELIPSDGSAAIPAKMRVDCRLGIPPGPVFAANVLVQETGLNFNRWVQGVTLIYAIHVDPPPM